MKKIIAGLALLFISAVCFADDQPHIVPALSCQAGATCCPIALVCSYANGCGDVGRWQTSGSPAPFQGLKTFKISAIQAQSEGSPPKIFAYMNCMYEGGIVLTKMGSYTLVGDWQYSFLNQTANCPNADSLSCTAENAH